MVRSEQRQELGSVARPTHFPADLSAETRGRRTGRAEGLLVRKGEAALGGGVTHLPPR